MQFNASTEIEVVPPDSPDAQSGLHLIRGMISFFHRDEPGRIRVITRGAVAGVEGTEFVVAVNETDRTTVSVIDGKVRFGNEQATLLLTNGQQAIADVGNPPVRTPGFIANNLCNGAFITPPCSTSPTWRLRKTNKQSSRNHSTPIARVICWLRWQNTRPHGRPPPTASAFIMLPWCSVSARSRKL